MRTSKVTIDEMAAAELAAENRKNSRANGFSMIKQRDAGGALIRNHYGGTVRMEWPTNREADDYEAIRHIPDNYFVLTIDGKEMLLDAEEFRKHLRWV